MTPITGKMFILITMDLRSGSRTVWDLGSRTGPHSDNRTDFSTRFIRRKCHWVVEKLLIRGSPTEFSLGFLEGFSIRILDGS